MKSLRTLISLLLALLFGATAGAQTLFSGRVVDSDGLGVIGAGVVCSGRPDRGTVCDEDGSFRLEVPKGISKVEISALGMQSVVYDLENSAVKDALIVLEYESTMLDQVVVTGYAQTTVKRITGSVGILNSDSFKDTPLASVSSLMQGEVAGVQVQAVSGQPGTQSRIRIRGTNNLSGSSNPLWVVDGVPLQNESPNLSSEEMAAGAFDNIFISGIGGINPNDIESITILKDAAAAAIYGSRAANGVIVVTTKRGSEGRLKLSYSNNFTWSFRPQRNLELGRCAPAADSSPAGTRRGRTPICRSWPPRRPTGTGNFSATPSPTTTTSRSAEAATRRHITYPWATTTTTAC